MNDALDEQVGGAWLAARYRLEPVMPLAVVSRIGGRRATRLADGLATETYVEAMRPAPDLRGHLTFHLKHEVPHLELLARLFEAIDPRELVEWIQAEPTGQYARRAGFLYEFLSGRRLPIDPVAAGAYVDAIDARRLVVASPGLEVTDRRWRVRNNLPGTPAFCPVVRKTTEMLRATALDLPALIEALALEFGEDLLMRSAVWMTLRESRSSFAIEGEAHQAERIQRFADVLSRRTGQGSIPLDASSLAELQSEILGGRTSLRAFGLRRSPVFVGEVARYQEIVHYIAPPAADLAAMLDGLSTFLARTRGQSPVMRSAVAAFGFIYIHPLADGNGRVHRFLVNDILRRDGAIPDPVILPVSALIARDSSERRAYDRILDEVSRPLMRSLTGLYEFSPTPVGYADGIRSNFVFRGERQARAAWRLPDLTPHVSYLANVLERVIRDDMREESRYLRSHAQARAAIKDVIEMPDVHADCIIRSVQANQGRLSGVLSEEIPALREPRVWEAIRDAVERAFGSGA